MACGDAVEVVRNDLSVLVQQFQGKEAGAVYILEDLGRRAAGDVYQLLFAALQFGVGSVDAQTGNIVGRGH